MGRLFAAGPVGPVLGDGGGHVRHAARPGDAAEGRANELHGFVCLAIQPDLDRRVEVLEAAQRERRASPWNSRLPV